eukprot:Colp12_sorted_trinity150504_noHs@35188
MGRMTLKPLVVFALFLGTALAGCPFSGMGGANPHTSSSAVVRLNKDNIDSFLSRGSEWMVLFTASGCGSCEEWQKTWDELALKHRKIVHVGLVDAAEERVLGKRFEIKRLPTVFQ